MILLSLVVETMALSMVLAVEQVATQVVILRVIPDKDIIALY